MKKIIEQKQRIRKNVRQDIEDTDPFRPKILAPVGDFISLKAALDARCDEIYFGIKGFNMRAGAKNFELKDLKKIVRMCHDKNIKAYLTINIIIYEDETNKLTKLVKAAKDAGIDAIICWDMAVINECQRQDMDIHLSLD